MQSKRTIAIWLKQRSEEVTSGCWEWCGGRHGTGYGCVPVWVHKSHYAHRAMFAAVCAEIPPGMYVLHSCDNRKCINPEHLWLGTHLENIKDMQSKGRHRGGSLPNELNPKHKFSNETVALIRERAAAGIQKKYIEREFGVSESQYYRIVKRQSRGSLA